MASEVVRLAKYNLYRYIGCIIYQSNWSGPFSLVVMTLICNLATVVCVPARLKVFIYRSVFLLLLHWCLVPG